MIRAKGTVSTGDNSDLLAAALAEYLLERAHGYLPEAGDGSVDVQLKTKKVRSASTLYEYSLVMGSSTYEVLAKVLPREQGLQSVSDVRDSTDRPRLAYPLGGERKCEHEYRALSTIHDYFRTMDDPRFGTVRILDHIPAHRALIMQFVRQPHLRRVFLRTTLLPVPASTVDLYTVFRNAGGWLRLYHAMPVDWHVEHRHTRRAEFTDFIRDVTAFLGTRLGDRSFFEWVANTTVAAAMDALPEALPVGLNHGDYAMRNILVDSRNRITVIDTLGRWHTSIYEDLATFLVGLRVTGPQMLGFRTLRRLCRTPEYEDAFLTGYFGQEEIPRLPLALYEVQAMLNKWAAIVAAPSRRTGRRAGVVRSVNENLICQFFRTQIQQKLSAADY